MTRCRTASGGMDWLTAAAPIVKLGTGYSVIWSSYIAFLMFGMLYVLKGIFIDTAISVMNKSRMPRRNVHMIVHSLQMLPFMHVMHSFCSS